MQGLPNIIEGSEEMCSRQSIIFSYKIKVIYEINFAAFSINGI